MEGGGGQMVKLGKPEVKSFSDPLNRGRPATKGTLQQATRATTTSNNAAPVDCFMVRTPATPCGMMALGMQAAARSTASDELRDESS